MLNEYFFLKYKFNMTLEATGIYNWALRFPSLYEKMEKKRSITLNGISNFLKKINHWIIQIKLKTEHGTVKGLLKYLQYINEIEDDLSLYILHNLNFVVSFYTIFLSFKNSLKKAKKQKNIHYAGF